MGTILGNGAPKRWPGCPCVGFVSLLLDFSAAQKASLRRTSELGEMPRPLITGEDLSRLGFVQGPEMGKILKRAFEAQLEGRVKTRTQALAWVRSQLP